MTPNKFRDDVIETTTILLEGMADNIFYKNTIASIKESVGSLSISDEKKAEMIISLEMDMAKSTAFKAMDQAAFICEKNIKLDLEKNLLLKQIDNITNEIDTRTSSNAKDLVIKDKQAAKIDKDIALLDTQQDEVQETVFDRQQKRPIEVANLTKQGTLIDGQISKLNEDKLYVISQKEKMIEQVEHNKIIKAMDSMGDMIGTLGAGGLIINPAMFGVYFRLNKLLTNQDEPTSYSVTKAV